MALNRVRIYRFFSLFFCTLLLFTWSTATMAYSDIDGHWAEDAVRRWRDEYGILQSVDGRFRPTAEVTRAEVAMLLDALFCYPDSEASFFPVVFAIHLMWVLQVCIRFIKNADFLCL